MKLKRFNGIPGGSSAAIKNIDNNVIGEDENSKRNREDGNVSNKVGNPGRKTHFHIGKSAKTDLEGSDDDFKDNSGIAFEETEDEFEEPDKDHNNENKGDDNGAKPTGTKGNWPEGESDDEADNKAEKHGGKGRDN